MIYAFLIAALYAGSGMGQFGGGMGQMGMGGGGCSIDQKCFIPCPDYTLADAFPFVRQTPVTCDDCMNLCNALQAAQPPFTCQAAVYDAMIGSCDIFAVSDQSMGFGRRKRAGQPHKQKYPGRILLQPTGFCAGQGGNSTAAPGATTAAGAASAASSAAAETTTASSSTTSAAVRRKLMKDQQVIRRRDDVAPSSRCIARRNKANVRDCSAGLRQVGKSGRRVSCVPTHAECMAS